MNKKKILLKKNSNKNNLPKMNNYKKIKILHSPNKIQFQVKEI